MNENTQSIRNAFDDINIIKGSIEKSKNNSQFFSKMLIFYGISNLIYILITTSISISNVSLALKINYTTFLTVIFYIIILIYYLRRGKKEKLSSNKYYASFLKIWISIILLLPLLQLVIRMLHYFASSNFEVVSRSFLLLTYLGNFSNILLLFFCIILSGDILNRKSFKFFAIMMILLYLIISTLFIDVSLPVVRNISIPLVKIYYDTVLSVGYIILGRFLKSGVYNKHGLA